MNTPKVYRWKEMMDRVRSDARFGRAIQYLSPIEQEEGISLTRLWSILDAAWNELDVKPEKQEALAEYYRHPAWLLNSAFSESDSETISDRAATARLIAHARPATVLDFGGGIGTCARVCVETLPGIIRADVLDAPEYADSAKNHLAHLPAVRIVERPDPPYDAALCCEVLEHVADPIACIRSLNASLRPGGVLGASWSFAPGLKCHLPQHFHLRHGMLWVVRTMGFGFYGMERRASPSFSFIKQRECDDQMEAQARRLAKLFAIPLPLHRILLLLRGL